MSNDLHVKEDFQKYKSMVRFWNQHPMGRIRSFIHRADRRKNKRLLRQSFRPSYSSVKVHPIFVNGINKGGAL
jgi:hypothetical protein